MSNQKFNKEQILQRMYKHAANFWGLKNKDDLDPFVRYIIEATSSELEHVYHSQFDMRFRMLEQLANLMTPEILIHPHPAHAILQVKPVESELEIDCRSTFFDKQLTNEMRKQGIDRLNFVPVANVKVIRAEIKHMICERVLYQVNGTDNMIMAHSPVVAERLNNVIYIGLEIDKEIESLKDVTFYIDFPRSEQKYDNISLVPFAKWSLSSTPLKMASGLPSLDENNKDDSPMSIFNDYNLLNISNKNILNYYQKQFCQIAEDIKITSVSKEVFPKDVEGVFPEELYNSFTPKIWIKVAFPVTIPSDDLQNITITLNAFPVANKTLYSNVYNANGLIGIIPLKTHPKEYFLSVDNVADSFGNQYNSLQYRSDSETISGSYSLKKGGIERLDSRDATDYIERLIDLLRSEVSAFNSLDVDNIRTIMDKVLTGLSSIESRLSVNQSNIKVEATSYLLINTITPNDIVLVDFWATNCEYANGVKSGKVLTPASNILIEQNSAVLLCPTSGGKKPPGITGKLDAFRYALTSRDRITTHADIVNAIKMELNDKIRDVEVRKGIMVSPKPKEGLIRVLDVILYPAEAYKELFQDNQMIDEIKRMLESKSPDTFNYRIIIKNETINHS